MYLTQVMSWRDFFKGMGSVLDISGTSFEAEIPSRYRRRPKTDAEALRSDWAAVESDFAMVIDDFESASKQTR